ncbi:hypothetical protein Rsub_07056 [Raphidocelis subcapitata]|uniref:Transcription factor IIIC subunit 5 HTH domain-containing protein n=1 Tax=Raphidocelis subcapitata TaxID=307507 RepID=A0A2V0P6G9_9CHLO|nr:hypothetical protein Rsub_07056 [Raphidocelis subcapitata]|eukprot:GBF94522.1 hypothetical protein Rsub_07056 [Raphidocelis subcapitata]
MDWEGASGGGASGSGGTPDGAAADVDAVCVPAAAAAAIEFPGYIRNPDRALAALGGAPAPAAALDARAGVLKLWLRPEDPLSHPLFGERRRARALLLRVSRRRGDPGAPVQVGVAAAVRCAYRFTGLADYQYLPVDPRAGTRSFSGLPERNRPESAEVHKRPQPFLLVPPLFSRCDVPTQFAFSDAAADADGAGAGGDEEVRVISFYNPEVPLARRLRAPEAAATPDAAATPEAAPTPEAPPTPDAGEAEAGAGEAEAEAGGDSPGPRAAPSPAARRRAELFQELAARLQERPVWPGAKLLQGLQEGAAARDVRRAVAAMCYQFKTGPWKAQYIRCGYDPRTTRDSRQYQALSYRCPAEWHARVKQARAAGLELREPSFDEIHSFEAMPLERTTQIILADAAASDEATRQLLSIVAAPEAAGEASGWCSRQGLAQLAASVAARFERLLASGHEPRIAEPGGGGGGGGGREEGAAAARRAEPRRASDAARDGGRSPMEVDGAAGAAAEAARARAAAPGAGLVRTASEVERDAAAFLPEALLDGLVRDMEAAPGEVQAWLSEQQRRAEGDADGGGGGRRRQGGGGGGGGASQTEGSETDDASASDWSEGEL